MILPAFRMSSRIVDRITATEFTEQGIGPLVDTVIPGQHGRHSVLPAGNFATCSAGMSVRQRHIAGCTGGRHGPTLGQTVASASGEDDGLIALALVIVHVAPALALIRFRFRMLIRLILVDAERCGQCFCQHGRTTCHGRCFQTPVTAVSPGGQHPSVRAARSGSRWRIGAHSGSFVGRCRISCGRTFKTSRHVIQTTDIRRRGARLDGIDRIETALSGTSSTGGGYQTERFASRGGSICSRRRESLHGIESGGLAMARIQRIAVRLPLHGAGWA